MIIPTAYWGSIAYFRAIAKQSEVVLEAKEHFIKQTYRSRCDILSANGILSLSIPCERPNGNKSVIDTVRLSDDENWRARHWRSIVSAYQSAPYFDYYGMEIEELLFYPTDSLLELNENILRRVLQWLDIELHFSRSKSFSPPIEKDPREHLVSKKKINEYLTPPYIQVFPQINSFTEQISILDAILCEGPIARKLILD